MGDEISDVFGRIDAAALVDMAILFGAIYWALLLTAFFFLFLIFIPILGHMDTYGVHKTVPNANAPAAEAHD